MASETEGMPQGVFQCQLCAVSAPYSYVGQKPPNTRSVVCCPVWQPPGGMLHPEGPLHRRQGQVPGPWLSMQHLWQAGVRGPGLQLILLQEILPPLCPREHERFPTGDPARCGEEESFGQDALRRARFSDLRAG